MIKVPIHFREYKASGAGGQHRNKRFTAIEGFVECPECGKKISASAEDRSQASNKKAVRMLLRTRLYSHLSDDHAPDGSRERYKAGRAVVRSYRETDDSVVCGFTGLRIGSYRDIVLKGKIGPAIDHTSNAVSSLP